MKNKLRLDEKILDLADEVWCREQHGGLSLWLVAKAKTLLRLEFEEAVRKADEISLELLCQALQGVEQLITVHRHLDCMLAE